MSEWIVRRGSFERKVPDTPTLVRLVQDKRLKANDEVFHPLTEQWLNACDVPDLKEAFAAQLVGTNETHASMAGQPAQRQGIVPERPPAFPPSTSNRLSEAMPSWGSSSRILGIIGGAIAIVGGITLFGLKAAGDNSLIEAIAHGLGIYCIGKGLFMIAAVANLKDAIDFIMQHNRR